MAVPTLAPVSELLGRAVAAAYVSILAPVAFAAFIIAWLALALMLARLL